MITVRGCRMKPRRSAVFQHKDQADGRDRRRVADVQAAGDGALPRGEPRVAASCGAAALSAGGRFAERRPPGGSGALLAPLPLGRLPWHQRRVDVLQHDLASDHAPGDVLAARDVVHHREQDLLQDGAQAARPGAAQDGLVGDRLQRVLTELQLHAIELEKASVLADQGVLRLGQDADQRLPIQLVHTRDHRQPADELWDHAVLEQVLRHHVGEDVAAVDLVLRVQYGAEADRLLADPSLDHLVQAGEGATDDEQHVGGVDLDELLVRVLAAALGRHARSGAFQDLQQCLLYAFTGDVPGDRGVLALTGNLVDLVDVDDPGFGLLDVVVGRLDQLEQDVLDVLADVAGLGQRGRVGNGERHVEHLGQRLRQQGLAATGRTEQQDVGLGQLDGVFLDATGLDPLVVVVDGHRWRLFRHLLADDVAVEELVDLAGLGQLVPLKIGGVGELLLDDLVAKVDALVADVDAWACDELLDLFLRLTAEGALQQVTAVTDACHPDPLPVSPSSGHPGIPSTAACAVSRPCRVGTVCRWSSSRWSSSRWCSPPTMLALTVPPQPSRRSPIGSGGVSAAGGSVSRAAGQPAGKPDSLRVVITSSISP